MTLLTHVAEARGLDYGYAFALVNLAWAPGETVGAAGGGAVAHGDRGRRALPDALCCIASLTLAGAVGA